MVTDFENLRVMLKSLFLLKNLLKKRGDNGDYKAIDLLIELAGRRIIEDQMRRLLG